MALRAMGRSRVGTASHGGGLPVWRWFIGVDAFFVLSGFRHPLLLDELGRTGRIDL